MVSQTDADKAAYNCMRLGYKLGREQAARALERVGQPKAAAMIRSLWLRLMGSIDPGQINARLYDVVEKYEPRKKARKPPATENS